MSNREEFEKWAEKKGFDTRLICIKDGRLYASLETEKVWEAWQARQPEIDALMAENERLRKDTERYQWLKQNPDVWIQVDNRKGKTIYRVVSDGEASGTRHQSYDNALDAAMKEAK